MGRWVRCGLLALLLVFLAPVAVQAAEAPVFHAQLSAVQGREGEAADLLVSYDGSLGPVGAFLLRIHYDPTRFQFVRTRTLGLLENAYTTTSAKDEGLVSFVYTQRDAATCLDRPGDILSFRFQVREGAPAGLADFTLSVTQAVTPQAEALDGDFMDTSAFQVIGLPSPDASLLSLEPSVGRLDQPFTSGQLFYTMTVPCNVTSLVFTAQPAEGASCWVNRKNLGAQGSDTDFLITVTAEDGKTKRVYTVTVHREEEEPLRSDAYLLSLVPASGQLEPAFSPGHLSYSMSVGHEVTFMTFTAQGAPGSSYRVNRKNLGAQGSDTDFLITVTAEDGKTKRVYTVTVHREEEEPLRSDAYLLSLVPASGQLEPAFSPGHLSYSMSVGHDVTFMTFTAQAAPGASYRVNRKNLGAQGSDTDFLITVTAEDGKTKRVYTVTVHREEEEPLRSDAYLLSLVPASGQLEPAFSPGHLSYSMSVGHDVTFMTFTAQAAPGSSYRVNRKNLGAQGSDTDFLITVTAEDGKTKRVYTVTVHREEEEPLRSDAYLLSLVPASGQLEPAFSPGHLSYSMSVGHDVTFMTFTAQASPGASYRVNRKNLGAGGSSTEFLIVVTAEDGKSKKTYTVAVYREERVVEAASTAPSGTAGPAATPKPSPTPKATPAPTQAPTPEAMEIPVWVEGGEGISAPPEASDISQARSPAPVLIIQEGGNPSAYVLAVGLSLLAAYASGPLAKLLMGLLGKKGRK